MAKANPEGIKWPTDKAKYDENYQKIFGTTCKDCGFYDNDKIDHDGAYSGWGCCCPVKCPYGKAIK